MSELKALSRSFAKWRSSPEKFVEEALKVEYVAVWQREALQALASTDRIAVRSGHGVGKTAFLAWVVLWFVLLHLPCRVPITANRQDQLSDVVWAEIQFWYKKLHPALQNLLVITSDKIEWKAAPKDGFAVARTARKEAPEAFHGFHAPHMLFVADEASGVDDIIFEVGSGSMSTPGAKILLTGNPTRTSGYFYNAFHKNREMWWRRRVSVLELIEEGAPWVSPTYPGTVAQEYGQDSNVYRYRVLGDFAVEDDDAVIPRGLIEDATLRDVEPTGQIVWGVDVARFGDDSSALVKRRGNAVMDLPIVWQGKDIVQTTGIIVREWNETKKVLRPKWVTVDSIGVGAGVADNLREHGLPVRDVNVSETSSADEKFVRLRDELWWNAREWFEAKDCRVVEDPRLVEELASVKYTFTPSGKIKAESKDEMKKRGLKSPNVADAFIGTFAVRNLRPSVWNRPIQWDRYQKPGQFV